MTRAIAYAGLVCAVLAFAVAMCTGIASAAQCNCPAPVEPTPVVSPLATPQLSRNVQWLPVVALNVPTSTPPAIVGKCPCYADLYNCADFASQYEAQQCYNWCMVQGLGDPHRLDRDADNVACENNN